ncbi:MAG: sigma-54-dependent Fis family transcriptional regulator [Nitrospirae bacterium]|nr:sigma-54-dependent Fis family transcriptional regulator [Nitrospirota bacterium]
MDAITKREIGTILDSTHDGMIAVNASGTVTLFNRAAERITGLQADKVIGRPAVEAIPNTRLHIVLATGDPELNKQQHLGTTVIITNRVPIRSEEGKIVGAVAVFRDITEIKSLAEQVTDLWKARNLLEAVIQATEDAISVADENGNTIIVNPAYTRITGMPKEAVLNKPVTVDIAEGESMHMEVLRTGKPVHHVRLKVGPAKKEVIVNVAPIFIEGKIRGSVGVIHDISEIIALTEELSRAKRLLRHLEARYKWEDIIGNSPVIVRAKEQAKMAAETPATVLLRGESGTGKELFAHAIHNASPRRKGQFVRVNCAAISENLLESELFGYEEGAFTGALKGGKKGLFEEANGGTIFLDEIGDISPGVQSKLLRVLQEKEIIRVGGTRSVPVDVRIISATNANLEQKVHSKTFREDLYYRLNVIPIHIPSLREHKEDISPLAEHIIFKLNQEFGREVQKLSEGALQDLLLYDWPGNVRELENVLGRAMISMRPQDTFMELEHLPLLPCEKISYASPLSGPVLPLEKVIADAERGVIMRALQETRGNRTKAAGLLGISMRSLFYKIEKYGLKND